MLYLESITMPEVGSNLIDFLQRLNEERSADFNSPDNKLWRKQYRAQHPTEVAALKCMDGRLNLPYMTETPPGIIRPFRNIGGKFEIGWPYFGLLIKEWVEYSVSKGRDCMVIVTYHYSKGDAHRGCRGHNYDKDAAMDNALKLKRDIEDVYGPKHLVVYPIVVGIETDEDSMIIHGEDVTDVLDVSQSGDMSEFEIRHKLANFFPTMKEKVIDDLLPLVMGNVRHVKKIRESNRPLGDIEHKEQIIAYGRGFAWMHLPNKALIIGPYGSNHAEMLVPAGKIIMDNLDSGRIPKEQGVVLLTSAVYKDHGPERLWAIKKAKVLGDFARKTLHSQVPEIVPFLQELVCVVNEHTQEMTPISINGVEVPLE
jgi:hypothetical protein